MYLYTNKKAQKTAFLPVDVQKRRRMGMEIYAICKLLQKSRHHSKKYLLLNSSRYLDEVISFSISL